jgi:hypothetical protein
VSAVLITSDGQKLIVTAPRFHYIFDAPAPLVMALRAPYRKSLSGSLLTLKVESSGACHVYYTVALDAAASPAEQSAAQADGFSASGGGSGGAREIRGLMRGRRYAANGVHPDASQVTLNRAYTVRVEAEPSGFALALTPLAKATDGVLRLAALPLVPLLLPLMLPGPAGLR